MADRARGKAAGRRTAKTKGAKARGPAAKASGTVRRRRPASAKPAKASSETGRRRSAAKRATSSGAAKRSKLGAVATAVRGTVAGTVAAVQRAVSGRRAPDAIVLLESDHRRMEDLLKRGEETTARGVERRRALLGTIASELEAHELIEEKVFYPALQSHPEARDIVMEGFEEHHVADVVLEELGDVAADQERWGAKFKVLQETIQHHIDEEEGEMFRTARAVLGQDELDALGKRMASMKARARR